MLTIEEYNWTLTAHARLRMQQRSISAAALELLLTFGDCAPAGGRALSYRFSRKTWKEVCEALGDRANTFSKFRHIYLIEDGLGTIITVGWLH